MEIEREPIEQLERHPPPRRTGRADHDADEHATSDEDADADRQPRADPPPDAAVRAAATAPGVTARLSATARRHGCACSIASATTWA